MSGNIDNDEDDSVFIKEEIKKEANIIHELIELMGTLLKTHTNTMLKIISETKFIEIFMIELIKEGRSKVEKQLAICIFDDIVEFSKEQSHPLMDVFVPYLIKYSKDQHPAVRQACTYGFGVVSEHGGQAIKPYLEKIFNILLEVILAQDSRSKKNVYPTENAISSIGKIIQFQPQFLGNKLPEVMQQWLSFLPIESDIIEAKSVNERICNFIQSDHPYIFGDNYSNLPKILSIFSHSILTKYAKKETSEQMISLLFQMKSKQPELFLNTFKMLPSPSQEKLSRFLN